MANEFFGKRPGLLVVVSGPAGSGKGTVTRQLVASSDDYALSISATTRNLGKNEKEGIDYYKKTRAEFEEMLKNGELLEYTEYDGNYYGTPKGPVLNAIGAGKNLLLEIDVEGGAQIKKAFPEAVLVMLVPPGVTEQERRLRDRGRDSGDSIEHRLVRAREELKRLPSYDYLIVNETGKQDETVELLREIITVEQLSARRNPGAAETYFNH